jgi:hypothetical protein
MASPELTINLSVKSQLYKLSGGSPESLSGYIVAVHSAGNGGRGQLASGNGASTAGIGFQRGLAAVASRWLPRSFLCSFQRAGAGRLEILVPPAAVADMVVVDIAAADTSAVDTLWPPHMLGSDQDLVYASRRSVAAVYSSRVDTVAISGTAVGGTTALARAGGGRMFTASTLGVRLGLRRRSGALRRAAFTNFRSKACRIPGQGQVCPRCGRPKRPERVSCSPDFSQC